MWLIDQLAERQIQQAIERGELDDLPGAGRPLTLDDDRLVPEHLRAGYRLLKNAGFLPPEVQAMHEIRDVEALLAQVIDADDRAHLTRRLQLLEMRLAEGRGWGLALAARAGYREKLLAALSKDAPKVEPSDEAQR